MIGNINACNLAFLYDENGENIGMTNDTPNCLAWAMANYPQIRYAETYYPMFGNKRTDRERLTDRISTYKKRPDLPECKKFKIATLIY